MNLKSLGNFDIEKLYKMLEKKAPTLGTAYGILGPWASTATGGESWLDAIVREVSAAFTHPQVPTLQGVVGWWKDWASDTGKNGFLLWIAGEVLGSKNLSKAGANVLKGTVFSALVGEIGRGGGRPYTGMRELAPVGGGGSSKPLRGS